MNKFLKSFCSFFNKKQSVKGFTLIELSISLLLISSVAVFAVTKMTTGDKIADNAEVTYKLKKIKSALTDYVNANGAFLCPSDPTLSADDEGFGEPTTDADGFCDTGVGVDDDNAVGYVLESSGPDVYRFPVLVEDDFSMGAIPWKALNLPKDYAFDSNGNRLFYAVANILSVPSQCTKYVNESPSDATDLTITPHQFKILKEYDTGENQATNFADSSKWFYSDPTMDPFAVIGYLGEDAVGAYPNDGGANRISAISVGGGKFIGDSIYNEINHDMNGSFDKYFFSPTKPLGNPDSTVTGGNIQNITFGDSLVWINASDLAGLDITTCAHCKSCNAQHSDEEISFTTDFTQCTQTDFTDVSSICDCRNSGCDVGGGECCDNDTGLCETGADAGGGFCSASTSCVDTSECNYGVTGECCNTSTNLCEVSACTTNPYCANDTDCVNAGSPDCCNVTTEQCTEACAPVCSADRDCDDSDGTTLDCCFSDACGNIDTSTTPSGSSYVADKESKTCEGFCVNDSHCSALTGYECCDGNGWCIPCTNSCTTDVDCAGNEVCNPSNECEEVTLCNIEISYKPDNSAANYSSTLDIGGSNIYSKTLTSPDNDSTINESANDVSVNVSGEFIFSDSSGTGFTDERSLGTPSVTIRIEEPVNGTFSSDLIVAQLSDGAFTSCTANFDIDDRCELSNGAVSCSSISETSCVDTSDCNYNVTGKCCNTSTNLCEVSACAANPYCANDTNCVDAKSSNCCNVTTEQCTETCAASCSIDRDCNDSDGSTIDCCLSGTCGNFDSSSMPEGDTFRSRNFSEMGGVDIGGGGGPIGGGGGPIGGGGSCDGFCTMDSHCTETGYECCDGNGWCIACPTVCATDSDCESNEVCNPSNICEEVECDIEMTHGIDNSGDNYYTILRVNSYSLYSKTFSSADNDTTSINSVTDVGEGLSGSLVFSDFSGEGFDSTGVSETPIASIRIKEAINNTYSSSFTIVDESQGAFDECTGTFSIGDRCELVSPSTGCTSGGGGAGTPDYDCTGNGYDGPLSGASAETDCYYDCTLQTGSDGNYDYDADSGGTDTLVYSAEVSGAWNAATYCRYDCANHNYSYTSTWSYPSYCDSACQSELDSLGYGNSVTVSAAYNAGLAASLDSCTFNCGDLSITGSTAYQFSSDNVTDISQCCQSAPFAVHCSGGAGTGCTGGTINYIGPAIVESEIVANDYVVDGSDSVVSNGFSLATATYSNPGTINADIKYNGFNDIICSGGSDGFGGADISGLSLRTATEVTNLCNAISLGSPGGGNSNIWEGPTDSNVGFGTDYSGFEIEYSIINSGTQFSYTQRAGSSYGWGSYVPNTLQGADSYRYYQILELSSGSPVMATCPIDP